jgi:hypothetical protein
VSGEGEVNRKELQQLIKLEGDVGVVKY